MLFLKKLLPFLFLLFLLLFFFLREEKTISNNCTFGTYYGVCISNLDTRQQVDSLGTTVVHNWIHWDYSEKEIFEPFVKVEEVTEQMIAEYSSGSKDGIDWSVTDTQMKEFAGLTFVVGIGSGWLVDMPYYNGERITPDNIGREYYLGQLYLYTRSCVRRYGHQVIGWQIENEPNVAGEMIILGIRKGKSWYDSEFVTEVLKVLERAVREEDPDAWVTINFHTDIHYKREMKEWLSIIDVVGVDVYPNYFQGSPVRPDTVLARVTQAKKIANGKPVIVMETGYASAPSSFGYSEENQSAYIDEVYSKIYQAGGCGIFYYKLTSLEEDKSSILPQENYWGLVKKDGTYKKGWVTLKKHID